MWWSIELKEMKIKTLVILFFIVNGIFAQSKVYHQYNDEGLMMRWLIQDSKMWATLAKSGFQVEKKNLSTGATSIFNVKNNLISGDASEIESMNSFEFVSILLDEKKADISFFQNLFEDTYFDPDIIKEARRDLVDVTLHMNPKLILESGFGLFDSEIEGNTSYQYIIKSADPAVAPAFQLILNFNEEEYEPHSLPELDVKWNNRQALLRWRTNMHNQHYYGYEIQKSENNGPFTIVDSLIINPQDTLMDEFFHFIDRRIFLKDNETEYAFRIYGRNYLGERSSVFSEVRGRGDVGIGLSPLIESAERNNENILTLNWSIAERFQNNVNEWRVYVSEEWEGPYIVDSTGISPNTRSIKTFVLYDDSYFRVVAVDKNGDEFSSFPTLVVAADTIPPAIPVNISANIDTNGIVNLEWDQNTEKDFYAYKVFFGFDTTREMTLAHALPIKEANFQDTVGLISTNRELYYKITSVDRRNNRSVFSKIVVLEKPDILAPTEPAFYDFRPGPEQTEMFWYPSTSSDVSAQRLFRKKMGSETEWTLIKEWLIPEIDTFYRDEGLESLENYAYILQVEDEAGNLSRASRPIVVKTLPNHTDIAIDNWSVAWIENRSIEFSHQLFDSEIEEIRLFKKVEDGAPFELARLQSSELIYSDGNVKKGKNYKYFVQILFTDGAKSKYSEMKTIN